MFCDAVGVKLVSKLVSIIFEWPTGRKGTNMKLRIKKLIEEKQNEPHEVAELLHNVRKLQDDSDIGETITSRMYEISSMIGVIQAAYDSKDHDETFYRENIGGLMYLFERRFEDLDILVEALIEENSAMRSRAKAA
jgi:hypothetical protein